jgi:hypothetical protein
MAVPRLDPRVNSDRIYTYHDYAILHGQFGRRKHKAWYEFIPIFGKAKRSRTAIRLLPYKLGLSAGLGVLVMALAAWSYLSADNARLAYAAQDAKQSISTMDQAVAEAVSSNKQAEAELFAGANGKASEVVYPAQTKFITLTNIPNADGKTLVEQLYPLSSRVIKIDP